MRASVPALAVVLVVALLGAACSRTPPKRRLIVATRLLAHLSAGDGPIADDRCPVDGDRRPSLGCTRWRMVTNLPVDGAQRGKPVTVPIPRRTNVPAQSQVLEWSERLPGRPLDVRRPPTILAANESAVTADLAELAGPNPVPGLRLLLRTRQLVPEQVRSLPVVVPRDATLTLGLAIDPTAPHDGVEAVEFTLTAETPRGTHRLLEERLAVDDPVAARWNDRRVPLDAIAGPVWSFVFTTRLVPRPGADPVRLVAFPLWGAPDILVPGDDDRLGVILVSFDTLRADHVGVYGSTLPTTPNLDRLAAEGVVFDDVFAAYPSTTASHMTMLTGRYPAAHGMKFAGQPLRNRVSTLAEVLAAQGWRTGAVTEDAMLRADDGFSNGFDSYRENAGVEDVGRESRLAESTFAAAIDWMKAHADERFFLFLHTYVVHWPYEPPAEFNVFTTWRRDGTEMPIASAPQLEQFRHRYAGEARFGDALFERLRDELSALGLADRTLVVVTSDHGEEFGEHGGSSHARTLYDEVLHVPLIFWAPRTLAPPRRVPGPASLVDLMPTVLDVIGVPAPANLNGRILLGPPPAEPSDRVVYAENFRSDAHHVMARTADAKWVWDVRARRMVEAFDLKSDPGEQRPVADPAFRERGVRLVADYLKLEPSAGALPGPEPGPTPPAPEPADPATIEKLRALGYVE